MNTLFIKLSMKRGINLAYKDDKNLFAYLSD